MKELERGLLGRNKPAHWHARGAPTEQRARRRSGGPPHLTPSSRHLARRRTTGVNQWHWRRGFGDWQVPTVAVPFFVFVTLMMLCTDRCRGGARQRCLKRPRGFAKRYRVLRSYSTSLRAFESVAQTTQAQHAMVGDVVKAGDRAKYIVSLPALYGTKWGAQKRGLWLVA